MKMERNAAFILWPIITGLAFALFLSACAGPSVPGMTGTTPKVLPPVALDNRQRAAIEDAVRGRLKDPQSAIFGHMNAGRSASGLVFVCGWVNARNSFGGYVGSAPFMVAISGETGGVAVIGIDDASGRGGVEMTCLSEGIPLAKTASSG
jgi:hypothetical protein